jgi:hypothetical protein
VYELSWSFCIAERAALLAAVEARYEAGPFRRVDAPAWRSVEIGDSIVRENNAEPEFLARYLASATHEPVLSTYAGTVGTEFLPDGGERPIEPRGLPELWQPTDVLHFEFDLKKQREVYGGLSDRAVTLVKSLFPMKSRRARIDIKRAGVYSGWNGNYEPGMVRYEVHTTLELQLALYDDNDEMFDIRKETVEFWRHPILTPTGGLILNGQERQLAYDEFEAHDFAQIHRFAKRLKATMDGHNWKPKTALLRWLEAG